MADNQFYSELGPTPADWTGSSKGYKSNNILGNIAQGVGDVIKMGTTAADEYYKGTVKEEANTAVQGLFSQYGNDAAVTTGAGILAPTTAKPEAIQQATNQLGMLQQAMKNGTLKDSSFWAQAELISRQLKMRYPGYWEDIDKSMGELVGRKPAIALHHELSEEMQKSGSKEEAEYKNAKEAARSVGIVDPFAAEASGKPMTANAINAMVASRNAIKWDQESSQRQYTIAKDQNQVDETKALSAASRDAQAEIFSMLNASSSGLYQNVTEYKALATRIDQDRKNGTVDPKMQAQAVALSSQIDTAVNQILNKYTLKYAGDAPADKLQNHLSFLQTWAKNYTSNVAAGDKNYSASNTALLKSMNDADTYKFLNANDAFRMSHALTEAIGQQQELAWEVRNPTDVADRDLAIQDVMKKKHLLQGTAIADTTGEMQAQGVKDPKAYRNNVDIAMNAVVSDEIPPSLKTNAINALYGPQNMNFLNDTTKVKASERQPLFLKMTAPVMTKSVKEMYDKGQISAVDFQKHVDWSTKNAIDLLHDESAEINSISTNRKGVTVYYDATTGRLRPGTTNYEPTPKSAAGKIIAKAGENVQSDAANGAVYRANFILDRMKNIIQATGDDPLKVIPTMLNNAGITITEQGLDKSKMGDTGAEKAGKAVDQAQELAKDVFKNPENYPTNLSTAVAKGLGGSTTTSTDPEALTSPGASGLLSAAIDAIHRLAQHGAKNLEK